MKTKLLISVLIGLSCWLGGCSKKENANITVENKFVSRDSVEITIEQFLIISSHKELTRLKFIKYCDSNGLEYNIRSAASEFVWYSLYANDKTYQVGFKDDRMFAFY